jgi:hypothetical protein
VQDVKHRFEDSGSLANTDLDRERKEAAEIIKRVNSKATEIQTGLKLKKA